MKLYFHTVHLFLCMYKYKCKCLYIVHVGALPAIETFYRPSKRSFMLCFELTAGQKREKMSVRQFDFDKVLPQFAGAAAAAVTHLNANRKDRLPQHIQSIFAEEDRHCCSNK